MHTNVDSICFDLLETTIYMRYSLLEPNKLVLRDARLDILDARLAILDHKLAKLDQD